MSGFSSTVRQIPMAIQYPDSSIGDIKFVSHNTIPDGWLECDGRQLSRTTFIELFNKIGTTFGVGDGSTTFNLPDIRGRVPVARGQGASLTNRNLGDKGGEETHKLTIAEMPNHTHTVPLRGWNSHAGSAGADTPQTGGTISVDYTGGDGAHNNMQPFFALIAIIKVKNVAGYDPYVYRGNALTLGGIPSSGFALNTDVGSTGISNLVITNTATVITMTADTVVVRNSAGTMFRTLTCTTPITLTPTLAASTAYYLWLTLTGTTKALVLTTTNSAPACDYYKYLGGRFTDSSSRLYNILQTGYECSYIVDGTVLTALRMMVSGVSGDAFAPTWSAVSVKGSFIPSTASDVVGSLYQTTGGYVGMIAPNNKYGTYTNTTTCAPVLINSDSADPICVSFNMKLESNNIYYASNGNTYLRCLGWRENL